MNSSHELKICEFCGGLINDKSSYEIISKYLQENLIQPITIHNGYVSVEILSTGQQITLPNCAVCSVKKLLFVFS